MLPFYNHVEDDINRNINLFHAIGCEINDIYSLNKPIVQVFLHIHSVYSMHIYVCTYIHWCLHIQHTRKRRETELIAMVFMLTHVNSHTWSFPNRQTTVNPLLTVHPDFLTQRHLTYSLRMVSLVICQCTMSLQGMNLTDHPDHKVKSIS